MILQRDEKIKIWGWASAHEKVNVRFNRRSYSTKADASGNWIVQLPATKAGGPYTIDILASNKISIKEILFGDVWFCSGQSNMVHQVGIHDVTYAHEIEQANYSTIRQFLIPTLTNLSKAQSDLTTGYWQPAIGERLRSFSAVAYFFAKKIHEKYHVPVGIINASVGGTPIEAWTSEEGLQDFSSLQSTMEKNKDSSYVDHINRTAADHIKAISLPADAGLAGTTKWFDSSYIPNGWRPINIPGYWEDQGIKDLNGIVWYRREVTIPASMVGKSARIFLGRIVDADEFYLNGTLVGSTSYQYPQRRYSVSGGLLKKGKNIFVIRVTNTNGKGGFVTDKPYYIFSGTDTIDLKGSWSYKVGAAFQPMVEYAPAISAQNQPTALYNAMVAPVINYGIKGFCWYQGEANTGQPNQYENLQAALISDWRQKWRKNKAPFIYVQLPGFMDYNYLPEESNWARLRESQRKSLATPNTAMVVAIDLGEWNDIHPDNKKTVGERMALAAMKIAYHEDIVYSGPLYSTSVTNENKIIASFTETGTGLITNDGEAPACFAIAGLDKKFMWAKTRIEGDKIIVWNDEIPAPKYIRYAWADNPVNPNLYNKEGLPASPFRTDD